MCWPICHASNTNASNPAPQTQPPQAQVHAHDGPKPPRVPLRPHHPHRPMMTPGFISPADLGNISRLIHHRLRNKDYAFIGGVACSLLGSSRATHDFDILVPNGSKKKIIAALAKDKATFGTAEGEGMWVKIGKRRYNVDVIEPRQIGQMTFDARREVVRVRGVKVLRPERLLELKRRSFEMRDRRRVQSLDNDVRDMRFLSRYLGQRDKAGEDVCT